MGGVYVHIPFCRQACHYCNFHFSTLLENTNAVLASIVREAELRQPGWAIWCAPSGEDPLNASLLDSLYFGGGTPSLLKPDAMVDLVAQLDRLYPSAPGAERTLEANPDDVTPERIEAWKAAGFNRVSLGIQSFRERDLQWMQRAHNADEARASLDRLMEGGLPHISADLIYGIPGLDDAAWMANVEELVQRRVPHLSAYALTLEPRTAFAHRVGTGRDAAPDPDQAERQFRLLREGLAEAGYVHYEVSNWCLPGHVAVHNRSYWQGKPYLGLGPAAHGFDGRAERQWNRANNAVYQRTVDAAHAAGRLDMLPLEREQLSAAERLNEVLMTGLRTTWGLPRAVLSAFGEAAVEAVAAAARPLLEAGTLRSDADGYWLDASGLFLADGIAAELFVDAGELPPDALVLPEFIPPGDNPRWGGDPDGVA
jgi:oxygen-independent coproporphyrinogen-3 oxidase